MKPELHRQVKLCSDLRSAAIECIAETVGHLEENKTSEAEALSLLISALRRRGIDNYWYPSGGSVGSKQFGCVVVFDTAAQPRRTAFSSARTLASSEEVCWEGLGYFYSSPLSVAQDGRQVWGDFGATVYLGESSTARTFVRGVWNLSCELLSFATCRGTKTTKDLLGRFEKLASARGMENVAESETGPSMGAARFNIGHSYPWERLAKREFVDEDTDVSLAGRLWTIEPRVESTRYGNGAVSFHRVFALNREEIIVLPDCERLFRTVNMEWVLDPVVESTL